VVIRSQVSQVDYSPDFHPGGLGLTPGLGNQQQKLKNHLVSLKWPQAARRALNILKTPLFLA